MSKIGYVYGNFNEPVMSWMDNYGVETLYQENIGQEYSRPKRKEAISSLKAGDEIILSRLSNALRSLGELALFIEFIKLKEVRLISVEDEIDTQGEVFKRLSSLDLLGIIGRFPEEVMAVRKATGEEKKLKTLSKKTNKREARLKRDSLAISLYLGGHTIEMIMKKAGIRHSTLYNILKRNGIGRGRVIRKND